MCIKYVDKPRIRYLKAVTPQDLCSGIIYIYMYVCMYIHRYILTSEDYVPEGRDPSGLYVQVLHIYIYIYIYSVNKIHTKTGGNYERELH